MARAIVRHRWRERLAFCYPQHDFDAAHIEDYHLLEGIDHKATWPNEHRILPKRDVLTLKSLPSLRGFKRLADEGKRGHENILFRVIRPGAQDIGPLHADSSFGNVDGDCFNVWIGLYTTPGNGLRVMQNNEPLDLPLSSGEGVIFDHHLIHGGAINRSNKTRISIEFTVMK